MPQYINRKKHVATLTNYDECVKIGDCIVYTNGSGEVFVEPKNGKSIRLSPRHDGKVDITCHDGIMTPGSFNGLMGFTVHPHR